MNLEKNSTDGDISFVRIGKRVNIMADGAVSMPTLRVGTYHLKYDEDTNQNYLEELDPFDVSDGFIYSKIKDINDLVIASFDGVEGNLGFLLEGAKGTGKTFVSKLISSHLLEKGISTLIITDTFNLELLIGFLQKINIPVFVIFEEYDKLYTTNTPHTSSQNDQRRSSAFDQNKLLTFLDGMYQSKKLFCFIVNDVDSVSSYMINRPSRILYRFPFYGMEVEAIEMYCEKYLDSKPRIAEIKVISTILDSCFSFDMLKNLVEQCNKHDVSPFTAIKYMNIRPQHAHSSAYTIDIESMDEDYIYVIPSKYDRRFYGNPFSANRMISFDITPRETGNFGIIIKDGVPELVPLDIPSEIKEQHTINTSNSEAYAQGEVNIGPSDIKAVRGETVVLEKGTVRVIYSRNNEDFVWDWSTLADSEFSKRLNAITTKEDSVVYTSVKHKREF